MSTLNNYQTVLNMDLDYETLRLLQEEFRDDFVVEPKSNILSDSTLARQLQEQFEKDLPNEDFLLAKSLHDEFEREVTIAYPNNNLVYENKHESRNDTKGLVDPSWETIDPTPDIHVLFIAFNTKFFWGKLGSVCVSWSKRMKRCAGICSYQGQGGLCHITLSEPLLKLRPRKDLVETLLHEMIHAYLFVTNNNRDRDGHGPEFHKHMYRINNEAGTNISVYHDFHDEVKLYLQHWWRCDGVCRNWKPYFGFVKRSMNRAPGPNDKWWGNHSRSCSGTFVKIKSPEAPVKNNKKVEKPIEKPKADIRKYLGVKNENIPSTSGVTQNKVKGNLHTISNSNSGLNVSVTIPSKANNIHGFSKTGSKSSNGVKNSSSTIVITKKPPSSTVTSSISKTENLNNPDYETVRNHWLNKFTDNKRKKSEDGPVSSPNKLPKLSQASQDSCQNFQEAMCPVCSNMFPIYDLNGHLDICLDNNKNIEPTRECIVCSKVLKLEEYETHVNNCIKCNFDDISQPMIDLTNDSKENIFVEMNVCPSCNVEVELNEMDNHLMYFCVKKTNSVKTDVENEESVDCLACGKKVLKSGLKSHLDECLNEVFGKYEADKINEDKGESEYNCPCCMKLINEYEMNEHIDKCLISDNNLELEYSRPFV